MELYKRKGVFQPKAHWEYDGNNRCGRQNHNVWANSKAIMDAGITNNTADPEGGRIDRNEDGTASGFFEDCVSVGVTSVREAGISDEPAYEAYLRMLDEDLPVNLFMDVVIPSNHETSNREKLKAAQQKIEMFNRGNYYTGGVKIFLDGVCEAKQVRSRSLIQMIQIIEAPCSGNPKILMKFADWRMNRDFKFIYTPSATEQFAPPLMVWNTPLL